MTFRSIRKAGRRAIRPAVDGLEARALLNAAVHPHHDVAELRARVPKHVPIVTQFARSRTKGISTVPSNGDVNPYGVAYVPSNFPSGGLLNPGDVLVSNFN